MRIVKKLLIHAYQIDHKLAIYWVFHALCTGIIPIISMAFVHTVTNALSGKGAGTHRMLLLIIAIFFILSFLSESLAAYSEWKADTLITYVRMTIQNRLNTKMFRIPYELLEDSRFLDENYRIFQSLNSSTVGVECVLKVCFGLIGILLSLSGVAFVIFRAHLFLGAGCVCYLILGIYFAGKNASDQDKKHQEKSGYEKTIEDVFTTVNDTGNLKDIKLYGMDVLFKKYFQNNLQKLEQLLHDMQRHKEKRSSWFLCLLLAALSACYFAVLTLGYVRGVFDIPSISVSIYAIISFAAASSELFEKMERMMYESYSVAGLYDYLEAEEKEDAPEDSSIKDGRGEAYEWEVEGLCYQYPHTGGYALRNVSFQLKTGERAAIVGLNGAGKSTLIKCMTGLYRNYEGTITYRGCDIRRIPETVLWKSIGALFQDADVYPFPVRENVASTDQEIREEEVAAALKAADLSKKLLENDKSGGRYIKKLFSTDGIELSGGEKERLLFARLLYKNPDSVILDEPAANLDSFAEESMLKRLREVVSDKSILFVTHRLTSVMEMDKILLIQDGFLAESGNHAELMQKKGEYYRLYEIQKNYYHQEADA